MSDILVGRRPNHHRANNLALGAMIVVALAAIGVMALPLRCTLGLLGGDACAATLANTANAASPAVLVERPVLKPAIRAASKPAVQKAAPPAGQSLVAATFATLQLPATPSSSGTSLKAATISKAADAAPAVSAAPTTRRVSTTVIRAAVPVTAPLAPAADAGATPDPVPLAPLAADAPPPIATTPTAETAQAVAALEVAPVPLDKPAAAAAAKPDSAKSDSAKPDSDKTADAASGSMQVGGSGVSVRSGPSTSKSRIFALPAGQKVKVTGRQRGWVHLVDARGRAGWAYSTYFTKQ